VTPATVWACACCRQELEGEPAGYGYVTPADGPLSGLLLYGYPLCPHCWTKGQGTEAEAVIQAVNRFHLGDVTPSLGGFPLREIVAPAVPEPVAATKKRLPAYAREIAAARRRGLVPKREHAHITVTFDWRQDCAPGAVVHLPRDADPATDIDWQFVAGLDVFVMHADKDRPRLLRLVQALHAARALSIQTFDMDGVNAGRPGSYLNWTPNAV
jgi:hypothetical protein